MKHAIRTHAGNRNECVLPTTPEQLVKHAIRTHAGNRNECVLPTRREQFVKHVIGTHKAIAMNEYATQAIAMNVSCMPHTHTQAIAMNVCELDRSGSVHALNIDSTIEYFECLALLVYHCVIHINV